MRILTRYYISRFMGLFVMILVAAILILTTIELVLNLDDLSSFSSGQIDENSTGLSGAFRYLAIRIAANYLPELLPIASFLAMFLTFAWAGRALEIVVIQAGGIRLSRILTPVLGVALILSLAAALAHETIVLDARQFGMQESQQNRDPMKLEQRGDRRAFWHHQGRTIANIAYADPESRTLYAVEIFERGRSGRIVRVIRAESVRIREDGAWILANSAIWRFDEENAIAKPRYEFKKAMTLDLKTLGGDDLLGADPEILSFQDLSAYLVAHGDEKTSRLRQVAVRYHERLSSPWLVFAFGFLALPFALAVDRSGRFAPPAGLALATLGGFFLMRSAGITLAQEGLLPPAFASWIPISLIIIGTIAALRRTFAQ